MVWWSRLRRSGRAALVGAAALSVAVALLARLTGARASEALPLIFLPIVLAVVSCSFIEVVGICALQIALYTALIIPCSDPSHVTLHDTVRALVWTLVAVIGGWHSRQTRHERDMSRQRAAEQDTLLNAAEVVASARDLRGAMDATLRLARTIVPEANRGAVYLSDDERHHLVLATTYGLSPGEQLAEKLSLRGHRDPWTATPPAAFYEPDAKQSSGSRIVEVDPDARSLVCIGLRSLKGQVGMLYLGSTEPASFDHERLRFLETLCGRVSVALYRLKVEEGLQGLAFTDDLTNLPNHRSFRRNLADELKRHHRHHRHLSLLMVDLDDFKAVNDNYGHPVGNETLIRVAEVLRASLRSTDLVARYGGEEFAVVCPETPRHQAADVAERMRSAIADARFPLVDGSTFHLTLSAGIATFPEDAIDDAGLLSAADLALYEAKRSGKDRVAIAGIGSVRPPTARAS